NVERDSTHLHIEHRVGTGSASLLAQSDERGLPALLVPLGPGEAIVHPAGRRDGGNRPESVRTGNQQLRRWQGCNPGQRAGAHTKQSSLGALGGGIGAQRKQQLLLPPGGGFSVCFSLGSPGKPVEESHGQPAMKRSRDWLKRLACSEAAWVASCSFAN